MKKITYILAMALMLSSAFFQISCEGLINDEDDTTVDPNGGIDPVVDDAMYFSVNLQNNSLKPDADKASLDISNLEAVPANKGDLTLFWQNSYGYVITSPDGSLIREKADDDNVAYTNTKTTVVQNLGNVSLDSYDQLSELNNLKVTSGGIPNIPKKNQVQVSSGDVVAFQKGNVKGVAKVSGLSKVSKKITLTGYVNLTASSK